MSPGEVASTLDSLVENGDVVGCIRFARGLTDEQRALFVDDPWERARTLRNEGSRAWKDKHYAKTLPANHSQRLDAADTFAHALRAYQGLAELGLHPLSGATTGGKKEPRKGPDSLDAWAAHQLADSPGGFWAVFPVVLAGDCEPPDSDEWVMGLFRCAGEYSDAAPVFRALPGFTSKHVWRLFEVEGTSDCSLAGNDKYTHRSRGWTVTLLAMAAQGDVSRDGLLDASLDALNRGFIQFRAGWHSRLHEALEPTPAERAARTARYLQLVGSSVPPTVTFALKALAVIDKAGMLDASQLLEGVHPALSAASKSTVSLALRLIKSAVKQEPSQRSDAACLVARAFLHESVDVQKAALELIESWDVSQEPTVQAELELAADGVAASLRKRLGALLGARLSQSSSPTASAASPTPCWDPSRVEPISDVQALVRQFAFVLENPNQPIEIERVLGGLARLGTHRPAGWDALVSPLAKRARQLIDRRSEDWIVQDLTCLAQAWTNGGQFLAEKRLQRDRQWWLGPSLCDLSRERCRFLADRLARGALVPLLSEITDPRGWIDPDALVERALAHQASKQTTDLGDQVLALLRLGREGRPAALTAAKALQGELGEAIRFALGADNVKVGRTAALWIAAARARDPLSAHPRVAKRLGQLGAGAAGPGRCRAWIRTRSHTYDGRTYTFHDVQVTHEPAPAAVLGWELPTLMFHYGKDEKYQYGTCGGVCGFEESSVRWSATVAPGCTEEYFEVACERIDLDWAEAQWEVRCFFEPLLASDVVLGPWAYRFMSLGLAAKESGQHGMAIDASIAAIDDGRLDPSAMAVHMAEQFPTGVIKLGRWARTLAQVASAGDRHATVVRTLIQGALRGDPQAPPKDLAKLLELLHELCVDADDRVTDDDARTYLGALKAGGKSATLRKRLLAL